MIFGTDFAIVNEYVKDWEAFKAPLDLQFAFFRLTQGYNIYDNVYAIKSQAEGARSVGMLTAGWHQFDPVQSVSVQMENFIRSWNTQKFELRPILAVESGSRPDWAAVPANVQADMIEQCVHILTEEIYEPLIYTRENYWDNHVEQRPMWSTLKLWAARYIGINLKQAPTMLSPWSDGAYKFRDWPNYDKWFWQYTDKAKYPGIVVWPTDLVTSAAIDLDAFNGTRADLDALKMVAPTPAPVVDLDDLYAKMDELNNRMNKVAIAIENLGELHNGFASETVTNRNADKAEFNAFAEDIKRRMKSLGDGL